VHWDKMRIVLADWNKR